MLARDVVALLCESNLHFIPLVAVITLVHPSSDMNLFNCILTSSLLDCRQANLCFHFAGSGEKFAGHCKVT